MQYSIENLVRLARRANNAIRPYLYVNPLQGKHIPTKPEDVMGMCRALAEIVNDTYPEDKLYVIGFAETATGIASAISHYLNNVVYYQNTTREHPDGEEYLYFTESHSHAVDQMLRAFRIGECIREIDRMVFVDDEVTTASTICKLIHEMKSRYDVPDLKCSIVSILNSVPKERMELLKKEDIDFLFLSKLPFEYNKDSIMDVEYDKDRDVVIVSEDKDTAEEIEFVSSVNARNVSEFRKYDEENQRFAEFAGDILKLENHKNILILGTEEFMYPAFCLGQHLVKDRRAEKVKIHSTTRSPIVASGKGNYPLTGRYCIKSLYDGSRSTYVYNLIKYEKVIIVTDALKRDGGASDLIRALRSVGNQDITLLRWIYE